MSFQAWLVYLTLVLAATATPGPAVLFTTTVSTLYGWRTALFCALGNITGLLVLGIVAVTGLGAILDTSEMMFNGVKFAGAAYLIYMGIRLMRKKEAAAADPGAEGIVPRTVSRRAVYWRAFVVAVSNPKAVVFLTALLPQFLDTAAPVGPQFIVLILTLMTFSFLFLSGYALMAHQAGRWLHRPGRTLAVSRASGALFVGFGLLLAASSRR